jgi:hypothetical protein
MDSDIQGHGRKVSFDNVRAISDAHLCQPFTEEGNFLVGGKHF